MKHHQHRSELQKSMAWRINRIVSLTLELGGMSSKGQFIPANLINIWLLLFQNPNLRISIVKKKNAAEQKFGVAFTTIENPFLRNRWISDIENYRADCIEDNKLRSNAYIPIPQGQYFVILHIEDEEPDPKKKNSYRITLLKSATGEGGKQSNSFSEVDYFRSLIDALQEQDASQLFKRINSSFKRGNDHLQKLSSKDPYDSCYHPFRYNSKYLNLDDTDNSLPVTQLYINNLKKRLADRPKLSDEDFNRFQAPLQHVFDRVLDELLKSPIVATTRYGDNANNRLPFSNLFLYYKLATNNIPRGIRHRSHTLIKIFPTKQKKEILGYYKDLLKDIEECPGYIDGRCEHFFGFSTSDNYEQCILDNVDPYNADIIFEYLCEIFGDICPSIADTPLENGTLSFKKGVYGNPFMISPKDWENCSGKNRIKATSCVIHHLASMHSDNDNTVSMTVPVFVGGSPCVAATFILNAAPPNTDLSDTQITEKTWFDATVFYSRFVKSSLSRWLNEEIENAYKELISDTVEDTFFEYDLWGNGVIEESLLNAMQKRINVEMHKMACVYPFPEMSIVHIKSPRDTTKAREQYFSLPYEQAWFMVQKGSGPEFSDRDLYDYNLHPNPQYYRAVPTPPTLRPEHIGLFIQDKMDAVQKKLDKRLENEILSAGALHT